MHKREVDSRNGEIVGVAERNLYATGHAARVA